MVCMNTDTRIPSSAEARLDELARILAQAIFRMGTKKMGFERRNSLEIPAKTRLSVIASEIENDGEVI